MTAIQCFGMSLGVIEKPPRLDRETIRAAFGVLDFIVEFESAAGVLFSDAVATKRFRQDLKHLLEYRQVGGDFHVLAKRIRTFKF